MKFGSFEQGVEGLRVKSDLRDEFGIGILGTSGFVEFLEFQFVFWFWDHCACALRYAHSGAIFLEFPLDFAGLVIGGVNQGQAAVVNGRWRKSVFVLLLRVWVNCALFHVTLSLEEKTFHIQSGQKIVH